MATEEDILALSNMPINELIELLHGKEPCKRSAAAIKLLPVVDQVAEELLLQLSIEKCLYTKIAICESLEKGNLETSRKMIKYLGIIGNNQHKVPPNKISAKKSFPLPRDIIARSLGKMEISIFSSLMEIIRSNNIVHISEGLDAIGYMVFYNPVLATSENCKDILSLAHKYGGVPLVLWKVILCLSAFPCKESKEFLFGFAEENSVLGMEAERSLNIIENKIK